MPGEDTLRADFFIMPQVTSDLPGDDVDVREHNLPSRYALADPAFDRRGRIDLLCGVELANELTTGKRIREGSLTLDQSIFGWIVSGSVQLLRKCNADRVLQTNFVRQESDLDISRFWTVEDLPLNRCPRSKEEEFVEDHFDKTTITKPNGRYSVSLPFNTTVGTLGESKANAFKRFFSLERKLKQDVALYTQYRDFIKEFRDMGHLEVVPPDELAMSEKRCYYRPHHCVLKDNTTTKLRVVFDASALTSTRISLNDALMVGPKLQDDLFDHLLRFRCYPIGITGDLEKMYRQVALNKEDKDFHRILWRDVPYQPIDTYRMTRVTYGVASSCYHSVRSLIEAGKHSCVEETISRDFYVDDWLTGADDIPSAKKLINDVRCQLATKQFPLRKFVSSSREVMESLPSELRENEHEFSAKDYSVKALGIKWLPTNDVFVFKVAHDLKENMTKRSLLSDISKIFDPLGWLTPMTLPLKLIMQSSWSRGINWDDKLLDDMMETFLRWRTKVHNVENFDIPRHVVEDSFELHLFCDASETAYASCIYVRSTKTKSTNIFVAKSRVAPLKPLTVPKLELCAAVLGCKLLDHTRKALQKIGRNPKEVFGWTDATIVLCWINETPNVWNTFVRNRVHEVQEVLKPVSWRLVRSEENPADAATRGLDAMTLKNSSLWWHGPSWLSELRIPDQPKLTKVGSERKKEKRSCQQLPIGQTFFGRTIRSKLIRNEQTKFFSDEIRALNAGESVAKKSHLLRLYPLVDDGLIKVGGRLSQNQTLADDQRNQIVIPKKSWLAKLILQDIHLKYFHAPANTVLAELRRHFWIVDAQSVIRHLIRNCVTCQRFNGRSNPPLNNAFASIHPHWRGLCWSFCDTEWQTAVKVIFGFVCLLHNKGHTFGANIGFVLPVLYCCLETILC